MNMKTNISSVAVLLNLPGFLRQQFRNVLPGSSPRHSIFTERAGKPAIKTAKSAIKSDKEGAQK